MTFIDNINELALIDMFYDLPVEILQQLKINIEYTIES